MCEADWLSLGGCLWQEKIKTFRDSLEPVREVLKEQPFLGGQKPTYADYALVSIFLTAKCTSSFPVCIALLCPLPSAHSAGLAKPESVAVAVSAAPQSRG